MRKAFIDPNDPTNLTWSQMADAPGLASYRAACSGTANAMFWVGGSSVSYNYNGIAYNGSGGVAPSARILDFNQSNLQFTDDNSQTYGVMDLRGIAKLSNNRWIICGGMDSTQTVSNRTFLLENQSVYLSENEAVNFTVKSFEDRIEITSASDLEAQLTDTSGRVVQKFKEANNFIINRVDCKSGVYIFIQGGRSIRIKL